MCLSRLRWRFFDKTTKSSPNQNAIDLVSSGIEGRCLLQRQRIGSEVGLPPRERSVERFHLLFNFARTRKTHSSTALGGRCRGECSGRADKQERDSGGELHLGRSFLGVVEDAKQRKSDVCWDALR